MFTNQSTIVGNLVADPDLKYFDSGSVKVSFTVAVNRYWKDNNGETKEQTSYVDVNAWKFLAEDAARALVKGSRVSVTGRLEQQTWEDKNDGTKRSKILIIADEIALAISGVESYERRKREEKPEGQQQGQSRSQSARSASGASSRASAARVPVAAGAGRKPLVSREDVQESEEEPF